MGNLQEKGYKHHYNKYEDPINKGGPGFSGPFIHPSVNNFKEDIEKKFENRTLIEKSIENMIKFKDRNCLGYRKKKEGKVDDSDKAYEDVFTYFTYSQVHKMTLNFAKNIHLRNDLLYKDTFDNRDFKLIGIFARNCTEWVVTDMGCQMDSITTVTLYSTLGPDAFSYICNQTQISTICVSPDLVPMLIENKKKLNITSLRNAIIFDLTIDADSNCIEALNQGGFEVISFKSLIEENKEVNDKDLELSKPDTVLTICYTSGTTGNPKGVMVIQRNMIAMLVSCIADSGAPIDENGAHLSFLPLAHIMERFIIAGYMSVAAKVGFLTGSVKTTAARDIELLKPTLLFVVPRVLQTFRMKIFQSFDKLPGFKRRLAYKALSVKRENFRRYGVITHAFYDKVVFSQIRKTFGGEVKCILCSSAPLPRELAEDFKIFLSVPILEGWGMTEFAGPAFATNYTDYTNYTAGGVMSCSYMKVVDVPQLDYTSQTVINGVLSPSGEICIKGPATCIGYYKNEEENQKTFDSEGFLHTGDIGCLTPYNNGMKIVDRVKEIFKLSQGEYIIPNKLENVYSKSKYVNQILIYGNSTKNHIIAIIAPNKQCCAEFLNLSLDKEIETICNNIDLENEIRNDLSRLAKENNLNSLEKVTHFILTLEEFSIENDCITPTMKLIRKKIEKKYKEQIEELYNKTNEY